MLHISLIIATTSLCVASALAGPVPRRFDQREVRDNTEILARGDPDGGQSSQGPPRPLAHPAEAPPATEASSVLAQLHGAHASLNDLQNGHMKAEAMIGILGHLRVAATRSQNMGDHVTAQKHLIHIARGQQYLSTHFDTRLPVLEHISTLTHGTAQHLQRVTQSTPPPPRTDLDLARVTRTHHQTATELEGAASSLGSAVSSQKERPLLVSSEADLASADQALKRAGRSHRSAVAQIERIIGAADATLPHAEQGGTSSLPQRRRKGKGVNGS